MSLTFETRFLTFSGVARVKSNVSFLRPGPAANAKQPRQDDKRKKHGRESQGDLLWCWQNHPAGNPQTAGDSFWQETTPISARCGWRDRRRLKTNRSHTNVQCNCDTWDLNPGCSAQNNCAPRCNKDNRISGKDGFRIKASGDKFPVLIYGNAFFFLFPNIGRPNKGLRNDTIL